MIFEAELTFTRRLLENFHIKSVLVTDDISDASIIDYGLRKLFGMDREYMNLGAFLGFNVAPNTIYKMQDLFHCTYLILRLPDIIPATTLIIGPYTTISLTKNLLMQLTEKYEIPPNIFNTIQKYFDNVPYVENDNSLMVLVNTLGEKLWGDMKNFSIELIEPVPTIDKISTLIQSGLQDHESATIGMQAIETRYAVENQLIQAISQGLNHKAELLISDVNINRFEQRAADPIRNMQNYSIIMNTLFRKAAEAGSVHPLYIDRLSSDFGRKIESITSLESGTKLQREMIHKYCLLVKNHSMKGYSLLVQKVITLIDSDLTADLSLNAISKQLNINASYFSNLFKKETGSTLTEYVNKKRIQQGILLLNSTTLQIQTIAQYCGISDVNYFTKLFKKQIGQTPKEYREKFLHGS